MKVAKEVFREFTAVQAVDAGSSGVGDTLIKWQAGWWLLYEGDRLKDALSPEQFAEECEVMGADL